MEEMLIYSWALVEKICKYAYMLNYKYVYYGYVYFIKFHRPRVRTHGLNNKLFVVSSKTLTINSLRH